MNLIKRDVNYQAGLPRMFFDDFFGRELFNWENKNFSATSTTLPSVNIKETQENYEVEVAAPGLDKNDFKLALVGNLLTISCQKENQQTIEKEIFTRREFSYQSFQRSLELPENVVDQDKITARYVDGLLRLSIPKKQQAELKAPRMIEIS